MLKQRLKRLEEKMVPKVFRKVYVVMRHTSKDPLIDNESMPVEIDGKQFNNFEEFKNQLPDADDCDFIIVTIVN